MRDTPVVAGVGMVRFGRFPNASIEEMARLACRRAMDDASVPSQLVDSVFCGHVFQGRVAGQRVARDLGLSARPVINTENACASGSTAFHLAAEYVRSGTAQAVLVVGMEQLSVFGRGIIPPDTSDLEGRLGRTNPATYALIAKQYMSQYGVSLKELSHVVVKSRTNGVLNPYAQFQAPLTVEQVLEAPVIADPLTRYHCCPTGDGAAAAVVTSYKLAKRLNSRNPVAIEACVLEGGTLREVGDALYSHPTTVRAAKRAYESASIGPDDIDLAEVHDAFSIAEVIHTEDLGLCPRGAGTAWACDGKTSLGGERPINTSGGLLSRGHPYGATGLAQVHEIVRQLRGEGAERQVANARVGLTHTEGGVVYGLDTGSCVIAVLKAG